LGVGAVTGLIVVAVLLLRRRLAVRSRA